jgi:hypothetical protein
MSHSDDGNGEGRATELPAFRPAPDEFDPAGLYDIPIATYWPRVPATDASARWGELRVWVEQLQERFSHLDHHVIPRCWWQHNEHVEALCALRDYETSSFIRTAPPTAPAAWLRALRDVGELLRAWTAELGCGSVHQSRAAGVSAPPTEEWETFVHADVERRQARRTEPAGVVGREETRATAHPQPRRHPRELPQGRRPSGEDAVPVTRAYRPRVEEVATALRQAADVAGVELPSSYALRVTAAGLECASDLGLSRLGSGVVIHTVRATRNGLPILFGYADGRGQWYRDGTRHVEAPAADGPVETMGVGL